MQADRKTFPWSPPVDSAIVLFIMLAAPNLVATLMTNAPRAWIAVAALVPAAITALLFLGIAWWFERHLEGRAREDRRMQLMMGASLMSFIGLAISMAVYGSFASHFSSPISRVIWAGMPAIWGIFGALIASPLQKTLNKAGYS